MFRLTVVHFFIALRLNRCSLSYVHWRSMAWRQLLRKGQTTTSRTPQARSYDSLSYHLPNTWSSFNIAGIATQPRYTARLYQTRLYSTGSESETAEVTYTLAKGIHVAELEVKKSKFIAYAAHTESWPAAKDFLDNHVKVEHPKARHWCYGVCIGVDPVNERSSDDGEPTGTAGQPILQALRTEGLSDAVCVVVRYFGGVKLGAGGLIRAYGGAARNVLREAPRLECIPQSTVRVQVEATYIGTIYEMVGKVQGVCFDETYSDDGALTASVTCETSALSFLKDSLSDATKGTVKFVDPS